MSLSLAILMRSHGTSIANERAQQRRPVDLGPHTPIPAIDRRRLARGHLRQHVRDFYLIVVFLKFQKAGQMEDVAAGEADEKLRVCRRRETLETGEKRKDGIVLYCGV